MNILIYYITRFKLTVLPIIGLIIIGFTTPVPTATTYQLDLPTYTYKPYVEQNRYKHTIYPWIAENKKAEVRCLAENIYFESRSESIIGQSAVGLVTINRVNDSYFPNTICKVVYEQGKNRKGKLVAQFSWTLDNLSDVPKPSRSWENSKRLAQAMTAGGVLSNFADFTNGALYYHATYIDPKWTNLKFLMIIERHKFYTS